MLGRSRLEVSLRSGDIFPFTLSNAPVSPMWLCYPPVTCKAVTPERRIVTVDKASTDSTPFLGRIHPRTPPKHTQHSAYLCWLPGPWMQHQWGGTDTLLILELLHGLLHLWIRKTGLYCELQRSSVTFKFHGQISVYDSRSRYLFFKGTYVCLRLL